MEDLYQIGGVPTLMRLLLEAELIDGSQMMVTRKTISDNLAAATPLAPFGPAAGQQHIVHPLNRPIKQTGHIRILRGNLAPEGSVAKIAGK